MYDPKGNFKLPYLFNKVDACGRWDPLPGVNSTGDKD